MRRALAAVLVVMSLIGLALVSTGTAAAVTGRDITVSGTEVEMYPLFDPTIDRYAVTTTTNTAGTLDVTATPGAGETVTINGGSATHLTGLNAGDLITVAFNGGSDPHTYTLMYLPAGFPKLTVTTGAQGAFPDLAPGLIGLTLNMFSGPTYPAFDAIVDRNGVPVYAVAAAQQDLDLKQQPNGDTTVSRPPVSAPGATGVAQVTLDPGNDLAESTRREVVAPLTNTDGHDSVSLPDGSTILIGYQPNPDTGKTDATIQKLGATGNIIFQWDSSGEADETLATNGDYAHINSVVSAPNGDIIASFRHLSAVYRIATTAHDGYQPGDVIWRLGGRHSSFTFLGDPDLTGPCAQHDATLLPNGHILLFDNGTDNFCVDPADPVNGAGTARHYTHVKEYALDTTAHTASLVWSYPADLSKYSFFAGSASRLTNGDTLIGWAADRNALATEVDAAGNKLWELTTPATTPRYMTYRATLITGPQLTMTGPADGATFVKGDPAPANGTCADWVPDVTTSCVTSGLVGGDLDTATVGRHTWSVTATDGTGNTWSRTRSYTVRSGRQPDDLIRKAGSTVWKGSDVYGAATDQSVRQRIRRTHTRAVSWQVQNDGERADAFRLVAGASTRRVRVHYLSGGVDVTRAVVAGTFVTPTLGPGQVVTLTVTVTPTRRAKVGDVRTVTMAAVSVGDPTQVDRVATRVRVRR
jgi:hypothetical protein